MYGTSAFWIENASDLEKFGLNVGTNFKHFVFSAALVLSRLLILHLSKTIRLDYPGLVSYAAVVGALRDDTKNGCVGD